MHEFLRVPIDHRLAEILPKTTGSWVSKVWLTLLKLIRGLVEER
jgi:hypothetical protein